MNNKIMNISGVSCYEKDGTAYLNLEAVARGLGFTDKRNGVEYVRWARVDRFLDEINFATRGERPDYIPENIFYRLAMKAKNEVAEAFQAKIADEVIPSIRKHGAYMTQDTLEAAANDPEYVSKLVQSLSAETAKRKLLEDKIQNDAAKVSLVEAACSKPVQIGAYADFISRNSDFNISDDDLFRFFKRLGYCTGPNFFPEDDTPYFQVEERVTASISPGSAHIHRQVLITPEGQLFFLDKILTAAANRANRTANRTANN